MNGHHRLVVKGTTKQSAKPAIKNTDGMNSGPFLPTVAAAATAATKQFLWMMHVNKYYDPPNTIPRATGNNGSSLRTTKNDPPDIQTDVNIALVLPTNIASLTISIALLSVTMYPTGDIQPSKDPVLSLRRTDGSSTQVAAIVSTNTAPISASSVALPTAATLPPLLIIQLLIL